MAFNVSGLAAYTEQNKSNLLTAAVINANLTKHITIMPGVKGATTLNKIHSAVVFQDGSSCGWNASGNVTFSQRTINPGAFKINMSMCEMSLKNKYLEHDLRAKLGATEFSFEETMSDELCAGILAEVDKAMFQGDTTSGSGNLAFNDGFCTLVEADITSGAIAQGQVIAKGNDNVKTRTYKVYQGIAPANLGISEIWMNVANFEALVLDLMDDNLFHYKNDIDSNTFEITLPGTTTKVVGMAGLVGVDKIYAVVPREVVMGVDVESDATDYEFFYAKEADEYRWKVRFFAGINYAFPENIVVNK